jgi:hypothetical protein
VFIQESFFKLKLNHFLSHSFAVVSRFSPSDTHSFTHHFFIFLPSTYLYPHTFCIFSAIMKFLTITTAALTLGSHALARPTAGLLEDLPVSDITVTVSPRAEGGECIDNPDLSCITKNAAPVISEAGSVIGGVESEVAAVPGFVGAQVSSLVEKDIVDLPVITTVTGEVGSVVGGVEGEVAGVRKRDCTKIKRDTRKRQSLPVVSPIVNGVTGELSPVVGDVEGKVAGVVGGVESEVGSEVGAAAGPVVGAVTGAVGSTTHLKRQSIPVVSPIVSGVTGEVGSLVGGVEGEVTGVVGGVESKVGSTVGSVAGPVVGGVESTVGGVTHLKREAAITIITSSVSVLKTSVSSELSSICMLPLFPLGMSNISQ